MTTDNTDPAKESAMDKSTIYLWQREDIGTLGEQGNHIAHMTFKLAQHFYWHAPAKDQGDPIILTLSAWDMKALTKVIQKLNVNVIPHEIWQDPDHPDKGPIAVSTHPLIRPELYGDLFANYKLWPTVNLPQLFEKYFRADETTFYSKELCRHLIEDILRDMKLLRPIDTKLKANGQQLGDGAQ
ncbi:MAG TPA: hypothetical protein VGQ12_08030 [Candidatus Angelobacter sp.]|jgi:hypothetical protein|nr:hypothetical protein [Candidatus Angelobacter sp.]